jgi:SAM-dependent methyltransferase
MNIEKLRESWQAEESIARIKGWDFSHVNNKVKEDEMPWNYKQLIQRYIKENDKILDIDTGGGEFLLSLKHPYELTSATEGFAPNVALCRQRLGELGIDFREMTDYSRMPFGDDEFDVVINRHGAYDAEEIYRILKPGGIFITQQVGEDNDWDLVKRLLPEAKKKFPGHNLQKQVETFESCGFTALEKDEAHKPICFYDTGALVWFAKIIEWEFADFSVERCFQQLLEIEKEIGANGFVEGTVHRFYFVVRK